MNNKKQIDSKIIAIRVPTPILEKFKLKCKIENFRMSEVIRLYIRYFSENGLDIIKNHEQNKTQNML